jgi:hypothetical protein
MKKEQLIQKVYRCIDETYPDTTTQDLEEFNIPAFLDEAVRWVVNVVPVGALGEGTPHNSLTLPVDFLRLLEFKMDGWKVSVTEALSQNNPKYWQQQNPALRGGNSRPLVFLVNGETELEPYPYYEKEVTNEKWEGLKELVPAIKTLRVFKMPTDYTNYPDKLLDITAWKTAELVFSMMQDANGVSVAQAQIQNIMPTL